MLSGCEINAKPVAVEAEIRGSRDTARSGAAGSRIQALMKTSNARGNVKYREAFNSSLPRMACFENMFHLPEERPVTTARDDLS